MAEILYHYPLRGSTELVKGDSNRTHTVSGAVVDGNSKIGKSYKLDGVNDYMYLDDIGNITGKAVFLRLYFQGSLKDGDIFHIGKGNNRGERDLLLHMYGGVLHLTLDKGDTVQSVLYDGLVPDKWYDICFYAEQGHQKIIVDNVVRAVGSFDFDIRSIDTRIVLGKLGVDDFSYFGKFTINDLIIFDGEPSAKQLKELSLAKYVHLNFENSLQDVSGYGNHLTTTSTTHTFPTAEAQVGERCLKGEDDGEFEFPEYMTALYPFVTICFYVKRSTPISYERIFSAMDSKSANTNVVNCYFNNGQNLEFGYRNSAWEVRNAFPITGMTHIAYEIDCINKLRRIYINGNLQEETDIVGSAISTIRRYFNIFTGHLVDAGGLKCQAYLDDFRIYGSLLFQEGIQRIINERYFIDDQGNLFCYKKKISLANKGIQENGVAEFEDFQEGTVDGSNDVLTEIQNGKILKVNKIIEGY